MDGALNVESWAKVLKVTLTGADSSLFKPASLFWRLSFAFN